MRRRVPFWVALLPLTLAAAGYGLWWTKQLAGLAAEVAAVLPAGADIERGGFPYRLSITADAAGRRFAVGGASVRVAAADWAFERQPWRSGLTVVGAQQPELMVEGVAPVRLQVQAERGRASINELSRRISTEFEAARLAVDGVVAPTAAERLELHVREPLGPAAGVRGELFARGEGVQLGETRVAFVLDAAAMAPKPVADVAAWAAGGGTVVVRALTITGAEGELARVRATIRPVDGGLELAGTLATTCPRQFAALLGGPPVNGPEHRARTAVTLQLGGTAAAPRLAAPLPETIPVRKQEAPCPRLAASD